MDSARGAEPRMTSDDHLTRGPSSPVPYTLIRDALGEPREWVRTLARRLGAALPGPPQSLAGHIGPASTPAGIPRQRRHDTLTLRSVSNDVPADGRSRLTRRLTRPDHSGVPSAHLPTARGR